jgi:DNA modification methylase
MDCLQGLRQIESGTVSLIVADPPYELQQHNGAGAFGRKNREYHQGIDHLQSGVSNEVLEECLRVCKHPNMYIFCSKDQLPQLLDFALSHKLKYDLLTWHKTNPVPTCNNKYLSDTEYIVFMRNGANLYGTYETKRKYFITQTNTADKKAFGHPTPKPVPIIKTLIENSTLMGGVVLDPYMGSGTTAIACMQSGRKYIGFELNKEYYDKAVKRIKDVQAQPTLF